ncbi:cyclin-dependent protein kinase inhibitor SMR13-like [Salvia divinorum]
MRELEEVESIMFGNLELRLPMIKISNSTSKISRDHEEICRSEEEDYQMPRSLRHMIPAVLHCPQRRRSGATCKRRLCELEFFAREEINSLFIIVQVNNCNGYGSTKRNCFL